MMRNEQRGACDGGGLWWWRCLWWWKCLCLALVACLRTTTGKQVRSQCLPACAPQQVSKSINEKRAKRGLQPRPVRACVIGFPNIGKSALINRLINRRAVASAPKPGVTRLLQSDEEGRKGTVQGNFGPGVSESDASPCAHETGVHGPGQIIKPSVSMPNNGPGQIMPARVHMGLVCMVQVK
eukprot:1147274-Pelagomonas_calceolata.AAC.2